MPRELTLEDLSPFPEGMKNAGNRNYASLKSPQENSSITSTLTTATTQTSFEYQTDTLKNIERPRKKEKVRKPLSGETSDAPTSDVSSVSGESSSSEEKTYETVASDVRYLAANAHPKVYNLRPLKVVKDRDFEKMKETINAHQVVLMSKVVDTLSNFEKTRLEEDIFCDFLKRLLRDLAPAKKRVAIFKLHQIVMKEIDGYTVQEKPRNSSELENEFNDLVAQLGECKETNPVNSSVVLVHEIRDEPQNGSNM